MKKIFYNTKGITLIGLVITIIILLIVAGIAIGTLIGKDGILKRTKSSEEEYMQAQAKEKLELILYQLQMDKVTNQEYNNNDFIDDKFKNENMEINENIVIVDSFEFEIDREKLKIIKENGKIKPDINIVKDGITNNDLTGGWNQFLYNSSDTYISYNNNCIFFISSHKGNIVGMNSAKKINFTNIKSLYIEAEIYTNLDRLTNILYVGLCSTSDKNINNFDKVITETTKSTIAEMHKFYLDTSELSGDYYLKIAVQHGGEDGAFSAFANIYNIIGKRK